MLSQFVYREDPLAAYKFDLPSWLVTKFEDAGFTKLADHLHEVVLFLAIYTAIHLLSMVISPLVCSSYNKLSARNKVNFDIHVVSQVQCIYILLASAPMFFDEQLDTLESYSPYGGFVISSLIGYFIWDSIVCARNASMFGPAFTLHAITALFTFSQGMRPFLYDVAAPFIWFEASTPFVNVHWFGTHVPGLVSDSMALINGLCLIAVFFFCRIVAGSVNGFILFKGLVYDYPTSIPKWTAWGVFSCYVLLMGLNFVWFTKMIQAAVAKLTAKEKTE